MPHMLYIYTKRYKSMWLLPGRIARCVVGQQMLQQDFVRLLSRIFCLLLTRDSCWDAGCWRGGSTAHKGGQVVINELSNQGTCLRWSELYFFPRLLASFSFREAPTTPLAAIIAAWPHRVAYSVVIITCSNLALKVSLPLYLSHIYSLDVLTVYLAM